MKTLKRITVLLAIASFFAIQGYSQNAPAPAEKKNAQDQQTTTNVAPGKFVDNNKDGVCDNHEAKVKSGKCTTFTDKNGDGVCDNCKADCKAKCNADCKAKCKAKGDSKGCGMGCQNHGQGKGNGCGSECKNKSSCSKQNAPATEPVKSKDKKE